MVWVGFSFSRELFFCFLAIKIGDQSSQALGIGSVVSMRHHAGVPGVAAIRNFTLGRFEGGERQRVEAIFNERTVGLFVNERILNLPPLVALQLHLSIFEEVCCKIDWFLCCFNFPSRLVGCGENVGSRRAVRCGLFSVYYRGVPRLGR
jgi:hypothetical protein